MSVLNTILSGLFDAILVPLRGLPPLLGLTVISLVVSVAILLVFRWKSDQVALRAVKARIHAGIFEIRLYKDDLRAIFRAQGDILRHSARYMRLSLVPMLWIILPLSLSLIQLQFRYGYDGLELGKRAIIKVKLKDGLAAGSVDSQSDLPLSLEAPRGLRVESPMVWIPALREADWAVTPTAPGLHEIMVRAGEQELVKVVQVSRETARRSPVRPSRDFFDQLLYPLEPPLPTNALVESIEVRYPAANVNLLGWKTHWMVAFFLLTLVFAFVLQRPLRVSL